MSVDLGNSSPPSTPSRYPKRKRREVVYAEPVDDEGLNLDLPSEPESPESAAATEPESDEIEDGSDEEPEWGSRKKPRKSPPKQPKEIEPPRPKSFKFMSLPPELRNEIYRLALVGPLGIHIRSYNGHIQNRRIARHCAPRHCMPSPGHTILTAKDWLSRRHGDTSTTPEQHDYKPCLIPNLLAVSKHIYGEAAQMMYSQPFYFSDSSAMCTFFGRMRPKTMAMMQEITIISWQASRTHKFMNMPAMALLRGAVNLKQLHIFDTFVHGAYRIPSTPDGDGERSRHVAKKVYKDCYLWLQAVVSAGGIEALKKVLVLNEENFRHSHWTWSGPAQGTFTKERLRNCENIMFEKLLRFIVADA